MRIFLSLILYCVVCVSIFAAIANSGTKDIEQSPTLTEGHAYKLLYENQIKANDGILKTIFYALAGLGSATLLVFGSNWWFNEKKVKDLITESERKIAELKTSIQNEMAAKQQAFETRIVEQLSNIKNDVFNNINSRMAEFRTEFEQLRNSQESTTENKVSLLTNTVQKQLSAFEKLSDERYDLAKTYSDMVKAELQGLITTKVSESETKLRREAQKIQMAVYEQEGKLALSQDRFNPAFTAYAYSMRMRLTLDHLSIAHYKFEPLLASLRKIDYLWEDEYEIMEELLRKGKFESSSQKDEATRLLKAKEIKKFSKT